MINKRVVAFYHKYLFIISLFGEYTEKKHSIHILDIN